MLTGADALSGGPLATAATAPSSSPISVTQQQVNQLEATIAQQLSQGDALDQQYDSAQAQLQTVREKLAATESAIAATKATLAVDKAELARVAINAYVFATPNTRFTSLFTSPATKSDARAEYENAVVGNVTKAAAALQADQNQLAAQQSAQLAEQHQASAAATQAQSLASANAAQTQAAEATLSQVKGALAQEVAQAAVLQAQAAAAAAGTAKTLSGAQSAANAAAGAAAVASAVGDGSSNNAANQAAAAAASAAGVSVSGTSSGTAAGEAAVMAAISQLGVPYVYGGESPGSGFDCSGLTQWSWGRAGLAIPRTSEAQWAGLPHVALTSLQPGDLIFTEGSSPGHVVMYVGAGPYGSDTVIQAPHTGTSVSYASALFLGTITGAARP